MKKILFIIPLFLLFGFKSERLIEISASKQKTGSVPSLLYLDYTDYAQLVLNNPNGQVVYKLTNKKSFVDRVTGAYSEYLIKEDNSSFKVRISDTENPRKITLVYIKDAELIYNYNLDIVKLY